MTRILAYPDDGYRIDGPPADCQWCERCQIHARRNGKDACPICMPGSYDGNWKLWLAAHDEAENEEWVA